MSAGDWIWGWKLECNDKVNKYYVSFLSEWVIEWKWGWKWVRLQTIQIQNVMFVSKWVRMHRSEGECERRWQTIQVQCIIFLGEWEWMRVWKWVWNWECDGKLYKYNVSCFWMSEWVSEDVCVLVSIGVVKVYSLECEMAKVCEMFVWMRMWDRVIECGRVDGKRSYASVRTYVW